VTARSAALVALAGGLVAVLGAIGVASGDEPHLSFHRLDPWLVVYAIGVLVTLGSGPYGIYDRLGGRIEDRDARWDMALSVWGGCALVAGLLFAAVGLIAGFDPATAAGALALVGAGACALVVGTLLVVVLGTG
jgi:hypothetical protein